MHCLINIPIPTLDEAKYTLNTDNRYSKSAAHLKWTGYPFDKHPKLVTESALPIQLSLFLVSTYFTIFFKYEDLV